MTIHERDIDKPKVGVALLNWNGAEFTIPCIESLIAGKLPPWRVLVFDNGSTDGSPDSIGEAFPDVEIIRSPENIGFTGGNNAAIRELLSQGSDFIWVLNNDTLVEASCLSELVEECERGDNIGAVTGKILFHEPSEYIWYAGGRLRRWSFTAVHRGRGERDVGQYDMAGDVEFMSGCCMLMPRESFSQVGLFDDRYFIYGEDVDWCLRALHEGLRLRYVPSAELWHRVGATMRKNTVTESGGETSPMSHYYNHRNRLFNTRKHADRSLQRSVAIVVQIVRALPLCLGLVLRRRWDKLESVLGGLRDGLMDDL